MAKAKTIKCTKCDMSFSMPAHLGRHMSTIHGTKTRKVKKAKRGRRGRPPGTRVGRPPGKRLGRPKGISKKMGLTDMTIDELAQLIEASKAEAQRRIGELQRAFG